MRSIRIIGDEAGTVGHRRGGESGGVPVGVYANRALIVQFEHPDECADCVAILTQLGEEQRHTLRLSEGIHFLGIRVI